MIAYLHVRASWANWIERVIAGAANVELDILHKLVRVRVITREITTINILNKEKCVHEHLFKKVNRDHHLVSFSIQFNVCCLEARFKWGTIT